MASHVQGRVADPPDRNVMLTGCAYFVKESSYSYRSLRPGAGPRGSSKEMGILESWESGRLAKC